jgi:hypothetical protein
MTSLSTNLRCMIHALALHSVHHEVTPSRMRPLVRNLLGAIDLNPEIHSGRHQGIVMRRESLRSVVAVSAFAISWGASAAAQQRPGTNAPTPLPASESASSQPPTPIVREPFIEATAERSSLPNGPLLVTGAVVLGASYGASVVGAARSDSETDDKLYYPVVGPWMALNDRDCSADPCSRKTLDTTLLIGSGVLQGLGALSVLSSLFIPTTTTHSWYLIGDDNLNVTPVGGSAELGAVAIGRF